MPRSEAAKPKRVAKKAAKKVKPLTMEELVRWGKSHRACADGLARAQRFSTPAEWWEANGPKLNSDHSWTQAHALGPDDGACRCLGCIGKVAWTMIEARIIAEVRR